MPTWPGVRGVKTSFCLVYELWTFNTLIPGKYRVIIRGSEGTEISRFSGTLPGVIPAQVGFHRVVIRPGGRHFAALENIGVLVGENVVDPQCRGDVFICPADPESFLQPGILPGAAD